MLVYGTLPRKLGVVKSKYISSFSLLDSLLVSYGPIQPERGGLVMQYISAFSHEVSFRLRFRLSTACSSHHIRSSSDKKKLDHDIANNGKQIWQTS